MQVYELLLNISLIGCSLMVAWKMLMQLSGRGRFDVGPGFLPPDRRVRPMQ